MAKLSGLAGRKMFLGGVAVFLVTSVFTVLAYQDFQYIERIEVEIDGTLASIDQSRGKIQRIPRLERDVVVLRENLREYVKILPDEGEVNDFVNKINKFADVARVGVEKLDDLGGANRVQRGKKKKDPFEKVQYRLKLRGETAGIHRFINLFENYERFVRVSTVSIRPGKKESNQLDVDLELETFVYDAGESTNRVKIPDYRRKQEELAAEIVRSRDEIRVERYEMKATPSRRDPFLDPRVVPGGGEHEESQLTAEQQLQLVESLVAEVSDIDAMLAAEQAPETGDDLLRKAALKTEIDDSVRNLSRRVARIHEDRQITVPGLREKFATGVYDRVAQWMVDRRIDAPSQTHDVPRLREFVEVMSGAYARSVYDLVLSEFQKAEAGFPPIDTDDAEARDLILEIVALRDRALANKEFAERNIVVSGVIYRPDSSSVAVINGRVLGAGEVLDSEVSVRAIEETFVEFAFKQITIRRDVKSE